MNNLLNSQSCVDKHLALCYIIFDGKEQKFRFIHIHGRGHKNMPDKSVLQARIND